jgi:hypothetical protein
VDYGLCEHDHQPVMRQVPWSVDVYGLSSFKMLHLLGHLGWDGGCRMLLVCYSHISFSFTFNTRNMLSRGGKTAGNLYGATEFLRWNGPREKRGEKMHTIRREQSITVVLTSCKQQFVAGPARI